MIKSKNKKRQIYKNIILYNTLSMVLFFIFIPGCAFKNKKITHVHHTIKKSGWENQNKFFKIEKALINQYYHWKNTKYKIGGLSKKGIDCSGFVFLTFLDKFNTNLPRNTKFQMQSGYKIKKTQLKSGDLVFFKTGRKARHVGIYYKDQKFIHASSSKGITISNMNNQYWIKRYWLSRRVLY